MEFFNDATLLAAGHALSTLLQFHRLIFLVFGVDVSTKK